MTSIILLFNLLLVVKSFSLIIILPIRKNGCKWQEPNTTSDLLCILCSGQWYKFCFRQEKLFMFYVLFPLVFISLQRPYFSRCIYGFVTTHERMCNKFINAIHAFPYFQYILHINKSSHKVFEVKKPQKLFPLKWWDMCRLPKTLSKFSCSSCVPTSPLLLRICIIYVKKKKKMKSENRMSYTIFFNLHNIL